MNFDRILVTDRLAMEIFHQADKEKLLFLREPGNEPPGLRRSKITQRALSLLVLFDRVILHDMSHESKYRLPDLETDGIVEVVAAEWKATEPPLATQWNERDRRGKPPKQMMQSLALVRQHWPLVISRLLSGKSFDFVDSLAGHMEISRRSALETFVDYAITYAQGDSAAIERHELDSVLDDKLKKELFFYRDPLCSMNAILLFASLFAEEIAVIEQLSAKAGLPVATEFYGERFRSMPALTGEELDALQAANQLLILRAAFVDEGRFMPPITSIKQALRLRKDPYLGAIREQLQIFHNGLMRGDQNVVVAARREIQKAQRRLERRAGWDKILRWLTYCAVPAGIVESLVPLSGHLKSGH